MVYTIKKNIAQLSNKEMTVIWLPAHVVIPDNEKVDKLAKNGTFLPPRNHLALPDFNRLLRTSLQKSRQKEWQDNNYPHVFNIKPQLQHFASSNQHTLKTFLLPAGG